MAQGRRVRLVIRRVEPWTVLKFSVLLFATLYLVILVAGLVLWAAATATGVRGNVEKFIGDLIASDHFHLLGATVVRASVLGGAVLVVLGSGATVLFSVLYNLISDVVGGVIVVFEERPTRRRSAPSPVAPDEPAQALRPARQRARRPPLARGPDNSPPGPSPLQPGLVEPVELTRPAD